MMASSVVEGEQEGVMKKPCSSYNAQVYSLSICRPLISPRTFLNAVSYYRDVSEVLKHTRNSCNATDCEHPDKGMFVIA